MSQTSNDEIRTAVRETYSQIAVSDAGGCGTPAASSCCGPETPVQVGSLQLGYSETDLTSVPDGADLGLGCGNPGAIAGMKPGETVLDLGSGAGFDAFLSARAVGVEGHVIGVDMTPEMVTKARANAESGEYSHVEFRLGEIERLPVADASVDVIISNCVINLSPDKAAVFREAYRVLKPGGRLAISDVVASAALPADMADDLSLYSGCMAGASLVADLDDMMAAAGFEAIRIAPKDESKAFIEQWAPGRSITDYVVSATIEAIKPGVGVPAADPLPSDTVRAPTRPEERAMPTIRVYEPALCCNTGVCGPDVDESLVTFTADLGALKDLGIDIERHNLANDPTAFATDETVRAFLQVAGSEGLPLTLVDGVTVMTGSYPAREQLLKFAGVETEVVPAGVTLLGEADDSASCCGGTSCC